MNEVKTELEKRAEKLRKALSYTMKRALAIRGLLRDHPNLVRNLTPDDLHAIEIARRAFAALHSRVTP
jgi:hypothetical protein